MEKVLLTAAGMIYATTLIVSAENATPGMPSTNGASAASPAGRPVAKELNTEQKALRKELLEKYDTNKDGQLSKQEVAAMSEQDCGKFRVVYPPFQSNLQRPELTAEQKALRKELLEKYDTNKDGKLDKEEFAAIHKSKEDVEKAMKAGLIAFQNNLQKLNK